MEINPEITCQICSEKAPPNKPFHRHYGAICCVKCRSFFRRIVQINGVEADLRNVYQCISRQPNLRCDMQLFGTTHRCLHCRMEKCLEVGLRPDKVLLDKKARRKYTGKTKRKDFGKERFDQMIQNVDKSISMDWVETISEIGLSNNTPRELQDLFLHGQAIDTATLFNVVLSMKATLRKFISKNVFFGSLNENDQDVLYYQNSALLVQYCLVNFSNPTNSGSDQFSWLALFQTNDLDPQLMCQMTTISLKKLLFENGFIENEASQEVYEEQCYKAMTMLDGLTSPPGLAFMSILFSLELWNKSAMRRLREKQKVRNMHNLCISAMVAYWPDCSIDEAKAKFNRILPHLGKMVEVFPVSLDETRLVTLANPFLNTKENFHFWIQQQFWTMDEIFRQIRPPDLDQLLGSIMGVLNGTCQDDFAIGFMQSLGLLYHERAKAVLSQYEGLSHMAKSHEFRKACTLSTVVQLFKLDTMGSLQECINTIYGSPKDRDLGDCKYMPVMRYSHVNKKLNMISQETEQEMGGHISEIMQFVENSDHHKILYLLLLTDMEDNASCIRLRTALLSMIFHIESDGTQTEADILAPYLEMVSRMNKSYVLGKALLDLVSPFEI